MTPVLEALGYLLIILRNDLIWLELILLAVLLLAGERLGGVEFLAGLLKQCGRFAARPLMPYAALAVAAVVPRLVLLVWLPPAEPIVPDEFSHRFLADTLLTGRLSNPTHPLWVHFETLHIFHTPTYSSMYLPGQALFLAVGKLATGVYWAGVLLGAVLAVGSMLWMLRGLFPPGWAFLGAAFYMERAAMFSSWTEGYWGGHVPAAAGALVLGSVIRLSRTPRAAPAAVLAAGLALLAWTRPFEGFLFSGATAVCLTVAFVRSAEKARWVQAVILPVSVLLSLAGWATSGYCRSVTGRATTLPYLVNREIYGWPMTLPWQMPAEIKHRHAEHAMYYAWELSEHEKITAAEKIPVATIFKLLVLFSFYAGPLMAWPLLRWGTRALRFEGAKAVAFAGGAVMLGVLLEQTVYPHYASPAACAFYALLTAGWMAEGGSRRTQWSAILMVLVMAAAFVSRAAGLPVSPHLKAMSWCDPLREGEVRAGVQRSIERHPGRHLAIVRYNRTQYGRPWVYNGPDIDSQKLVWAQDLGADGNRDLLEYYRDRTVWLVEPDAKPARATILESRQTPD